MYHGSIIYPYPQVNFFYHGSIKFIKVDTYDNFCELLRGMMFNECDREMQNQGIPCECPIPTGRFTIPTQAITVTKEQIDKIPVWDALASGQYWMKAEFLDVYDRPMGCIQLQLEVDVNSDKKKRSLRIKAH
ncbi:hypothetical protein QZH41_006213 [Actinostola sp. cb2023]|nr:hypothetical protein QZH41_006213 [Actinostola sp. cb2023]